MPSCECLVGKEPWKRKHMVGGGWMDRCMYVCSGGQGVLCAVFCGTGGGRVGVLYCSRSLDVLLSVVGR